MSRIVAFIDKLLGKSSFDNNFDEEKFKKKLHEKILVRNEACINKMSIMDISYPPMNIKSIVESECKFLRDLGWTITTCSVKYDLIPRQFCLTEISGYRK